MRLIDADALIADCEIYNAWDAQIVKAWLDDQPSVDIVRCGECKHWHENDFADGLSYGECGNGFVKKNVWTNETWFCADGERRADDE